MRSNEDNQKKKRIAHLVNSNLSKDDWWVSYLTWEVQIPATSRAGPADRTYHLSQFRIRYFAGQQTAVDIAKRQESDFGEPIVRRQECQSKK